MAALSLISLMVSVDIKHHVYLLFWMVVYLASYSDCPVSVNNFSHLIDVTPIEKMSSMITVTYYHTQFTNHLQCRPADRNSVLLCSSTV